MRRWTSKLLLGILYINTSAFHGNTVSWTDPTQAVLHVNKSGDLTISFYKDQIMAQGKPEPLKNFITYYSNTINRMISPFVSLTSVVAARQEPAIYPETFELSQEQSEVEYIVLENSQ